MKVATVYDLMMANYGLDRGLRRRFRRPRPMIRTCRSLPAWAEKITGVKRDAIVTVAREFAENAEKTNGRSMVILGAGINHWYHMDMAYRGIINLLVFCGAIGQSGGGWSHYVGQGKAPAADRLGTARLRSRLGATVPPAEFDVLLLRSHRPVAL